MFDSALTAQRLFLNRSASNPLRLPPSDLESLSPAQYDAVHLCIEQALDEILNDPAVQTLAKQRALALLKERSSR